VCCGLGVPEQGARLERELRELAEPSAGARVAQRAQWISGCIVAHVLSMFLPGLVTGHVIGVLGRYPVMVIGVVLQIVCMAITLLKHRVATFYVGLVVLGVGWNFAFVSSTMMLLASHDPEERTKVTAFNETLRFTANCIASILSSTLPWDILSFTCLGWSIPLLIVTVLAVLRSWRTS